jgi:hypothetical protein
VAVNREDRSVIFFRTLTTSGPPAWVVLPLIFLAVAGIIAGPGELAGECFMRLRLRAYRYDLCGSLVGITLFTIFSFLGVPPLIWFLTISLAFVILLGKSAWSVSFTLLISTLAMSIYPLVTQQGVVFWSPYYRIDTFVGSDNNNGTQWQVYVNGVPHQRLTTAATPLLQEPFNDEPYRRIVKAPATGHDTVCGRHGVTSSTLSAR